MQTTSNKIATPKTSTNAMVTNPTTIYASKILGTDLNIDHGYLFESSFKNTLSEMWSQQHPLIHTWLVLSSISICFLTAFLFIVH